MATPSIAPTSKLPQRAIDLLAARNILRALAWHRKAAGGAPHSELFERLVQALESPRDDKDLAPLAISFRAIYEQVDTSPPRYAPVMAESVCTAAPPDRCACSSMVPNVSHFDLWWMPRTLVNADSRLQRRTEARDERTVGALTPEALAGMRAGGLGPLWPCGTPNWLISRWPARREFRKRDRRLWGDDRPAWPAHGARRTRPSSRLPAPVLGALGAGPFELIFEVDSEYHIPRDVPPKSRAVAYTVPLTPALERVALSARHRYRGPARPADLAKLRRRCGASPLLTPLADFYREHDGAFLFLPDGRPPASAPIEIVGLRHQDRAAAILLYDVQSGRIDDAEIVPALLAELDVAPESLHVLALVGNATLVVPLTGRHAARIFRIGPAARPTPFAPDFVAAVTMMSRRIVSLATGYRLLRHEAPPPRSPIPLMRLRSARPADPPSAPAGRVRRE